MPKGLVLVSNMNSLYIDLNYYQQLIDKLIFFTIIQSNIFYVINQLSSFTTIPKECNLDTTKHILCYIKNVLDYDIIYHRYT